MAPIRDTNLIETAVDTSASALFAVAVAYSVASLAGAAALIPPPAWGALSFLLMFVGLRSVPAKDLAYPLPAFEPAAIEPALGDEGPGELVLGADDRLPLSTDAPSAAAGQECELLLDDVLARLGPEARVVRLFAPDAMPTAGELNARIERHLGVGQSASIPPDASQALSDALAELRRSLR